MNDNLKNNSVSNEENVNNINQQGSNNIVSETKDVNQVKQNNYDDEPTYEYKKDNRTPLQKEIDNKNTNKSLYMVLAVFFGSIIVVSLIFVVLNSVGVISLTSLKPTTQSIKEYEKNEKKESVEDNESTDINEKEDEKDDTKEDNKEDLDGTNNIENNNPLDANGDTNENKNEQVNDNNNNSNNVNKNEYSKELNLLCSGVDANGNNYKYNTEEELEDVNKLLENANYCAAFSCMYTKGNNVYIKNCRTGQQSKATVQDLKIQTSLQYACLLVDNNGKYSDASTGIVCANGACTVSVAGVSYSAKCNIQ